MDALLVFGSDEWPIQAAAKAFLGKRSVMRFTADQLTSRSSEIGTALSQPQSLFGEQMGVWIQGASDRSTKALTALLAGASVPCVVSAGALDPKSSLRKLFATPGYASQEFRALNTGGKAQLIQSLLREIPPTPDAVELLKDRLPDDTGPARAYLATLAAFAQARGRCGIEEVILAVPDMREPSLFVVIDALLDRSPRAVLQAMPRLEEAPGIGLLRVAMRAFQTLAEARAQVDAGVAPAQAVRTLRPPVPAFKQATYTRWVQGWNARTIEAALGRLTRAEAHIKQGLPDDIEASAAVLAVAQMGR